MKKRILITNGHLRIGGVEKSLVNFLQAVDYSQYSVDLMLFEGTGEYLSEVPEEVNVIVCDLTKTYGSFFGVIKNNFFDLATIQKKIVLTLASKSNQKYLKYLYKTKPYDIALAYRVGTPMDFVSYGVEARKKYFWWHHGEFHYPDNLVKHWQNAARNMDGLVCVSKAIEKTVEPYFKPYVNQLYVVPNMVSPAELAIKANQPIDIDHSGAMIVSVGRFSEEKHMRDCVLAAERLIENGYKAFKWYLLGDGPLRESVIKEIQSKNLQNHVVCLGNMPNPYPYMKEADLIVHPSFIESQGMTVIEAMALGKLVVAVGSAGVLEYAVDHKNALVAEKNIDSLTANIEEALRMNQNTKDSIYSEAEKTALEYCPETVMSLIEKNLLSE